MALPSGYTKLDYIESSGTQYINTGFKPNHKTRCVIDIENLSSAQAAFFGARASQTAASFTYFSLTATTGRSDYGSSKQPMTFPNTVGRYTVDQNKNVCTANGVTVTGTANTFQLTNNLYLMAVNQADAAIQNAKLKLYSAKVYDNGTLIRDFIPCKNASGTIGLWDNVNSVFYANAGTGAFSTGKKHKTLIDGTGYEIKSGRVMIAGTGYDIKKGRTLIGGTGYDISFDTPVGELPVGTNVYMNVDGSRREFIIVQQGNPNPAIYDASCDGTWVLQKNVYSKVEWMHSGNSNYFQYYDESTALSHLNNTVLKTFDPAIQNLIKKVKIPCRISGWTDIRYGADGLLTSLFQLSATEVAGDEVKSATAENDGEQLTYFKAIAQADRIAYMNGEAVDWWLRSTRYTRLTGSWVKAYYYVMARGNLASTDSFNGTFGTLGERFAMVLPFEAMTDSDFNIIPS